MSKLPAKRGHARGQLQKQKTDVFSGYKKNKRYVAVIAAVVLAAIPFVLGKYFELSYPDPFDSGANVYSAKHILEGARIGIEEKPSAAMGTLLVNILGVWLFGFNEIGPKLIQGVFQAAALVFMFVAMRKLFGTLAAAVGVVVASVYLSSPFVAKFGNVKEQYMIACMVMGISCFILRQLKGGWWWAFLAGAFVSWAPLFKETGSSAIGAIGLFVVAEPFLKHRTFKQTAVDILLLLGGAAAAIAPLYIWIIGWDVQISLPYSFMWGAISGFFSASHAAVSQGNTYVSSVRSVMPLSGQWPRVLRFYLALCLPVSLALGSIVVRICKMVLNLSKRSLPAPPRCDYDRFVLLLAVWWILDMAFVWVSPASYEQYYLPLTASGAMTGGYLITVYRDKLAKAVSKTGWVVTGIVGFILMVIMSWHIFFGLPRSPYSGVKYPEKRNGYVQRWNEIWHRRHDGWKVPWEVAGEYIRDHTKPTDKIYVWGWVPGIYISAQRFSSTPNAFESEMHTRPPEQLAGVIRGLLTDFEKEMPKYIVDSRKRHLPLDRPQLELWPTVPKGFMGIQRPALLPPNNKELIAQYDKFWSEVLRRNFGEGEAARYEVLRPFREFVMKNYEITEPQLYVVTEDGQVIHRLFGEHRVFQLKKSAVIGGMHQ